MICECCEPGSIDSDQDRLIYPLDPEIIALPSWIAVGMTLASASGKPLRMKVDMFRIALPWEGDVEVWHSSLQ